MLTPYELSVRIVRGLEPDAPWGWAAAKTAGAVPWQFARFAASGAIVTGIASGTYCVLAKLYMSPVAANLCGWVLATVAGYYLHKHWSFRDRARPGKALRTTSRFFVVSLVGLAMNTAFVWLMTHVLGYSVFASVLPLVFVTPLVTFALNRCWVFADA